MVIKLSWTSLDEKFFTKSVIGQDSRRQVHSAQLNRRTLRSLTGAVSFSSLSQILHIAVLYFSNLDCRQNSSWGMLESSTFVWLRGTTSLSMKGVNFLTFPLLQNICASVCYLCDGVILIVAVHQSCDVRPATLYFLYICGTVVICGTGVNSGRFCGFRSAPYRIFCPSLPSYC